MQVRSWNAPRPHQAQARTRPRRSRCLALTPTTPGGGSHVATQSTAWTNILCVCGAACMVSADC